MAVESLLAPTVYLVEDDHDTRRALGWTLHEAGYHVVDFGTADECLQGTSPDVHGCLVLDLKLLETDALRLRQSLVARGVEQPFLVISAHGDVRAVAEAMRSGAIDFLEKPCSREVLLAAVSTAVNRDRTDAPAGG